MSENVLILGATSTIGRALCHTMAARGCRLVLAGRDEAELERSAADIRIRYGTDVDVERFDALDAHDRERVFGSAQERFDGKLGCVVLCYGHLGDQAAAQSQPDEARSIIDVNFTSAVLLLETAAAILESRGAGQIVAISSVAGDRGRQSNYVYGAAKAGLTAHLSGLRNRLSHHGVHVLTVKPGFVDTQMTFGLLKTDSPLVASPERVANDIDCAIRKRRDVIYTPWFWGMIMAVICMIPERAFKRLKL